MTVLGTRTGVRIRRDHVAVLVTLGLLVAMFTAGSIAYPAFGSGQVVIDLFIDNGFLLVIAIGMTFVILTGGIDLSVGAVAALSAMLCAFLLERWHWPVAVVLPLVLLVGAGIGFAMGYVIHHFEIQPFIATLAGMFLARGLCFVISVNQISIKNPFFTEWAQTRIPLPGDMNLTPTVLIALAVLAAAFWTLHYTRFGRGVYAVGGNAQSALLMGLPVTRIRIGAYVVSGLCSALGGVLFAFYTISASGLHAVGTELDAIAAVVIGGTLLTGGSGYVLGTVLGVMLLGTIQTLLRFQGTLSSWWTRIAIGALLLLFIVLQRLLGSSRPGR
ncbi:sugar ABC transporter permease [Planotetraspora thailandica]|uniref:Sugar ABC transporter permease n=1 Tax=Planotetraspora thailandica TaxID=487172 RepID=A0A8J3V4A8_9ACTN|nr:galactofuranose ABC transporter, permease protein YjfF [Planotetraspora thailandica]GII54751.1 sugar ABC transporter permease [Planotetraspora thailandica]